MIPYKHEPFTDFSQEANYNAYVEALNKVEGYLGQDYPLIIGGERITTEDKIVSYNPAKKTEVIGRVSKASKDLAEKAMQAADETFKTWKKVDPAIRADVLFKAAAIIRRRKHEFSALLKKRGNHGQRLMQIQRKQSTSWNTMVAKCYALKRSASRKPSR